MKKTRSKRFVEEASSEYASQRPLYVEFAAKLKDLLSELVTQQGIAFQTIEHRAKEIASLTEKLSRPSKAYTNGLADITDLCGLRVIAYTLSDVKRVCALVEREFALARQHTVDKAALLAPAEFGYRSRHFVVGMSPARDTLPEWKRFAGMRAEIQVRTILEHAWAAIDHALRYKRDEDVPREQKRTLFRLSALLEMADETFDTLREGQASHRLDAGRRIEAGATDSPELDSVTYPVYAQSSQVLKELMQLALESGLLDGEIDPKETGTKSELIARAKAQGLRTIRELDTVLRDEQKRAKGYLGELVKHAGKRTWHVTRDFVALLCLIRRDPTVTKNSLTKEAGWNESIAERVLSVAAADRARR